MRSHAALVSLALLVCAAPAAATWRGTSGMAAWYDGDLPTSSFRLSPTFGLNRNSHRFVLRVGIAREVTWGRRGR